MRFEARMEDQKTTETPTNGDKQGFALNKPMQKSTNVFVSVVAAVVLIAACVHAYAWWNDLWWASGAFKPGPVIQLETSDVTFGQNMAGTVVQGSVTNNTKTTYEDVQVEVELMDADGKVLGTATKTTETLVPGQVWEYQALMTFDKAISGKVKEVTGK